MAKMYALLKLYIVYSLVYQSPSHLFVMATLFLWMCSELPMCVNGTEDLSDRGFDVTTKWLWYDQIGLAVIAIIFLFLTYFNLRTIKKLK